MTTALSPRPAEPRYHHVVQFVREHPWAILPDTLDTIVEVVRMRASGARLSEDEIRQRIGAAGPAPAPRVAGRVQVIPVFGVIAHRMNVMTQISGGTSTEQLAAMFEAALIDPGVSAIVLDIDSPGGSVMGMQELADRIFKARGRKPVVAMANATAASAAYWIASQADEIVCTPSGQVGSIGCLAVHEDLSRQAEMLGVKVTYITEPSEAKAEGQPFQPLSDEARAAMQGRVREYYTTFRDAVARGRGVKPAAVESGFGGGRVVSAADAQRLGMIDRIDTLEGTLARLNQGPVASLTPRATSTEEAMKVVALPMPNAEESLADFTTRCTALDAEVTPESIVTHWNAAQALITSAAARASAPQVRDGEIVVTAEQLRILQADASKGQRLKSIEDQLRASEAAQVALAEQTRQERIAFKVRGLKIPAFRPFAKVFLQIATAAEGTFTLADAKKPLSAEAVVDAWLAEMNKHADATILATLSVSHAAVDRNEPDGTPGQRLDYRIKKYIAEHKLDAVKDYATAKAAVLEADPELKEAYARS